MIFFVLFTAFAPALHAQDSIFVQFSADFLQTITHMNYQINSPNIRQNNATDQPREIIKKVYFAIIMYAMYKTVSNYYELQTALNNHRQKSILSLWPYNSINLYTQFIITMSKIVLLVLVTNRFYKLIVETDSKVDS